MNDCSRLSIIEAIDGMKRSKPYSSSLDGTGISFDCSKYLASIKSIASAIADVKSEEGALVGVYCLDVDTGGSDDLGLPEDLLIVDDRLKEGTLIGALSSGIDTSDSADINVVRRLSTVRSVVINARHANLATRLLDSQIWHGLHPVTSKHHRSKSGPSIKWLSRPWVHRVLLVIMLCKEEEHCEYPITKNNSDETKI